MPEIPHFYLNPKGDIVSRLHTDGSVEEQSLDSITDILASNTHRLALVDRDGVVNQKAPKLQFVKSPEQLVLLPGTPAAFRYLNENGIPAVLITNNPLIYRRQMSLLFFYQINAYLQEMLAREGAHFDAVLFCPHPALNEGDKPAPSEICGCRKPEPGMVNLGLKLYGAPRSETKLFGDFESDVLAAKRAGIESVYVATRHDEYADMQQRIRKNHPEVYNQKQFASLLEAVTIFEAYYHSSRNTSLP